MLCVFPVPLTGESDAQTASPFPQRNLSLLCWQPAATGTDPQAVQHKAQTSRSRQAILVRGAVRVLTVSSVLLQVIQTEQAVE